MIDSSDEGDPRILVMDGNERNVNLLQEFLAGEGFDPVVATDVPTGAEYVGEGGLAFAIVDLDRFSGGIWGHCERLAEAGVPYLLLSGTESNTLRQKSRSVGAVRFLQKPVPKRALRDIIDTSICC